MVAVSPAVTAGIRAGPRTLLADALEVTDDEFVGYERLEEGRAPRNDRLRRKLREIEWLDEADRRAILRFVDALLAEQRFAHSRGRLQRAARRLDPASGVTAAPGRHAGASPRGRDRTRACAG